MHIIYYILNGNIKFNKYPSNEANDIDLSELDNLVLLKIDSVSSCVSLKDTSIYKYVMKRS